MTSAERPPLSSRSCDKRAQGPTRNLLRPLFLDQRLPLRLRLLIRFVAGGTQPRGVLFWRQ